MFLGSILLALAWAALQGEITLVNLMVGYMVGYAILALLARGGVMPSTLVSRTVHAFEFGDLLRVGTPARELSSRRRRDPRQSHGARCRRDTAGCHE